MDTRPLREHSRCRLGNRPPPHPEPPPAHQAGDICTLVGLGAADVGDSIADPRVTAALPSLPVDPPTLSVMIGPNTSPLVGRDGTKLLARQIKERLVAEALSNVSITVDDATGGDMVEVGGRGEPVLSIYGDRSPLRWDTPIDSRCRRPQAAVGHSDRDDAS